MAYIVTKQRNFAHIAYPSKANPDATVKSGGCGPCSMLMIVENLLGINWKMADWIKWVLTTGARVSGGTNMTTLAHAVAKKYDVNIGVTSDEARLAEHLTSGGMAIANVGGKRSGWSGLFSDAGHFITVFGYENGKYIIGDPGIYSGKFNTSFRRNKVTVSGDLVYVNAINLHKDTLTRNPNYYLINTNQTNKIEEVPEVAEVRFETYDALPDWGKEAVKYYMDAGKLKGDGNGKIDLSYDMVRILCITCPAIYNTVDECPAYAREVIQGLIDEGAIKGDAQGNLGLTLEMIRILVMDSRSIA